MKRLFFLIVLVGLIACKDNDVKPIVESYPLIKTVTSYNEDSDSPSNVIRYSYDDQDRMIKVTNENPGWLSSSVTTFEYVNDRHIKVNSGSSTSDYYFNERGDIIKWNDDTFSYKYEADKITMTITSDSDTWDMIFYLENNNVIKIEEPDADYVSEMDYDHKPNYEKSIDMSGSRTCANNVIHEREIHGDQLSEYEVTYTYVYNSNDYVIEKTRTATSGDWSSVRRYEIEYYQ